jgi:hypothetical protein
VCERCAQDRAHGHGGDHRYPKDVHHANRGLAARVLPICGYVREPDARAARRASEGRSTAIPLVINDIRKPVGQRSRRVRFRAPSPTHTETGASRSRIGLILSTCTIATVAAIGLTTSSLVLAASASATGLHHRKGAGNHTATEAGHGRTDGAGASSRPSTHDRPNNVDPNTVGKPAADPDASKAFAAGHDKCKRPKGNRRLLPWCTDPAGGWMGSTTHRVETNIPIPMGICDPSGPSPGCRPARPAA